MNKLTPLKILHLTLRRINKIAKIIKETIPQGDVYLTGGAAENRLTILSDIDIVVVLPEKPSFEEAVKLRVKIWKNLNSMKYQNMYH